MNYFFIFLAVIAFIVWLILRQKESEEKIFNYIDSYKFPERIKRKLKEKYPHLSNEELSLVLKSLKDYFKIAYRAKGKMVYMPSKVVDEAWHEFLLFSKEYEEFSKKIFGKYFHHYPAESMMSEYSFNSKMLTFKLACQLEGIDIQNSAKLPLLFEIDKKLNIDDGYEYFKSEFSDKKISKKSKKDKNSCSGGSSCSGCAGGDYKSESSHNSSSSHSHSSENSNAGHSCGGHSCSGGSCGGGCGGG